MDGPYLRHIRSKHLLDFDHRGVARVHARCDCAVLQVSREQSAEMMAALSAWKVVYWAPHLAQIAAEKQAAKIDREFASHFGPARGSASLRCSTVATIPRGSWGIAPSRFLKERRKKQTRDGEVECTPSLRQRKRGQGLRLLGK